jgi:Trehalose synthase, N-terminal domain
LQQPVLERQRPPPAQSSWQHHVSSTFYGGGVTEILTPLTLMMNAMGIETGWRMIQGTPAFFNCTKKLHNTLQGEAVEISKNEKAIYERVVFENATRLHIEDADAVIVHDPQPLPLINHFEERDAHWIWQCHVDLEAASGGDPAPENQSRYCDEQRGHHDVARGEQVHFRDLLQEVQGPEMAAVSDHSLADHHDARDQDVLLVVSPLALISWRIGSQVAGQEGHWERNAPGPSVEYILAEVARVPRTTATTTIPSVGEGL